VANIVDCQVEVEIVLCYFAIILACEVNRINDDRLLSHFIHMFYEVKDVALTVNKAFPTIRFNRT